MEYPNGPEHLPEYREYFHAARRARSAEVYRLAGLVRRGQSGAARALIAGTSRLLRWVDRRRQIRKAQRELEKMDDRLLNDLGITRDDIADVVRNGKPAPRWDLTREQRQPHEAKRAAEVVELRRERDLMGALILYGPWSHYTEPGRKHNDAA